MNIPRKKIEDDLTLMELAGLVADITRQLNEADIDTTGSYEDKMLFEELTLAVYQLENDMVAITEWYNGATPIGTKEDEDEMKLMLSTITTLPH